MCELKKIGKVFTSKFVGTGPSSFEKRIYRAAVSRRLRNTDLADQMALVWDLLLGLVVFKQAIRGQASARIQLWRTGGGDNRKHGDARSI